VYIVVVQTVWSDTMSTAIACCS